MSRSTETVLNIVAHEDDDLLFLSPDIYRAIHTYNNVITVYVTAGDVGISDDYWNRREIGAKAAYAQMCGVANSWTQTDAGIDGHPIPVFTLFGSPSVSLVFMRLPDGNFDGKGFVSTGCVSLQRLWMGVVSTIGAVDGTSSYTKATLTSTLVCLISSFQPDQVNVQDYVGTYGDGDHSDHHSVAYFVQSALQSYTAPHTLTGYEGYNTCSRPANVTGADLIAKQNAFFAYSQYDPIRGRVPRIVTQFGKVNVGFCCFSSLLSLYVRRWLKYVLHLIIGNSSSPCVNGYCVAWLQRQYTKGYSGGDKLLPVSDTSNDRQVMKK